LFAWAYFCLALSPVMGLTEQLLVVDHYQHIAVIGVVALVAGAWDTARQGVQRHGRWLANAAAAGVVLTLILLASRQSRLYSDNVTLFQAAVEQYPDAAMAHRDFAFVLLKAGRLQEAREHLEEALRLEPDYPEAHTDLGVTLARMGQLPEAIGHLEAAVRLRPGNAGARNDLGAALREAGRPEEALEHFQQALQLKPDFAKAHANLGKALAQLGRLSEAKEHFQEALRLDPDDAEVRHHLETVPHE
jgi:protein O-mannosyl-transferase